MAAGESVEVLSERLDDVVDEAVLLIKVGAVWRSRDTSPTQQRDLNPSLEQVDVEGYEPYVMNGAQKLLQHRRIENILLEYNPHGERGGGATNSGGASHETSREIDRKFPPEISRSQIMGHAPAYLSRSKSGIVVPSVPSHALAPYCSGGAMG